LKKYQTSDLLNYFGVSRDTLRFYEEKGLLFPKKNHENSYRNYDIMDIYNLMIIDFYKKRGMNIQQIQRLKKNSDIQDIEKLIESKKHEVKKIIDEAQSMLKRIEATQQFTSRLNDGLYNFSVKPMPLYKVNGEISDFIAIEEYENVKDIIREHQEDMLSQIMRYISFNEKGIAGTRMLIVEAADARMETGTYLDFPKCLHTVAEEIQPNAQENDLMIKMHSLSSEYADALGLKLLGEAFAMIRLISCRENTTKAYIEIFVPFE
jgi:DNA-binding transcriptional MerR regulator